MRGAPIASRALATQSEEPESKSQLSGSQGSDSRRALDFALRTITRFSLQLIHFYQHYISSWTPPSCRFQPTCSHYTYQAIERFGLGRGLWMGLRRLSRCQPFCPGGYDPVPEVLPSEAAPGTVSEKEKSAESTEGIR